MTPQDLPSHIFLTMKDERSLKEKISEDKDIKEAFKSIPDFIWELEDRIWNNLSKKEQILFSLDLAKILDEKESFSPTLLQKILLWIVESARKSAEKDLEKDKKATRAIQDVLDLLRDWERTGERPNKEKMEKASRAAYAASRAASDAASDAASQIFWSDLKVEFLRLLNGN